MKQPSKEPISFKIPIRKNCSFQYKLNASPSDGTLTCGHSIDIELSLKVMYTTTLDLCVPFLMWYGSQEDYENLVVKNKGKADRVFMCVLESKIQTLPSTRLDANELILTRPPIGQGGFGIVFRGSYRGIDVACKFLKNQEYLTAEEFKEFKREVEMFEVLHHPCIVIFVGAVFIPRSLCLVSEFCKYGSLVLAI